MFQKPYDQENTFGDNQNKTHATNCEARGDSTKTLGAQPPRRRPGPADPPQRPPGALLLRSLLGHEMESGPPLVESASAWLRSKFKRLPRPWHSTDIRTSNVTCAGRSFFGPHRVSIKKLPWDHVPCRKTDDVVLVNANCLLHRRCSSILWRCASTRQTRERRRQETGRTRIKTLTSVMRVAFSVKRGSLLRATLSLPSG